MKQLLQLLNQVWVRAHLDYVRQMKYANDMERAAKLARAEAESRWQRMVACRDLFVSLKGESHPVLLTEDEIASLDLPEDERMLLTAEPPVPPVDENEQPF